MEDEIIAFRNWLKARGRRAKTIELYERYLRKIPGGLLSDPKKLKEWLLSESKYTSKTIGFVSVCLRSYYRFKEDDAAQKVFSGMYYRWNKSIYCLNAEEAGRLIRACKTLNERLIIIIFLETGVRESIIKNLLLEDIDLEAKKITVKGKYEGNKSKRMYEAYFSDATKDMLSQYIQEKKIRNKKANVFDITTYRIWYLVKRLSREAGLPSWVSPHKLRHTFATNFYDKSGHIEALHELMGHKDMVSTSAYLHVSSEKKREEHKKVFGY